MDNSLPLHAFHVHKLLNFINRSYTMLSSVALSYLIYYRASYFFQDSQTTTCPMLPWLLIFVSEFLLAFDWLLTQAFYWRFITRTVFPERLPKDHKLPAIDVFIFTADPNNEPTVDVMNTVLSAMTLDYPADKLNVYLSDDSGSEITLYGMKEAFKFARSWLPFCKKYTIMTVCPKAYFNSANYESRSPGFIAEKKLVQEKYEVFKQRVSEAVDNWNANDTSIRDHSAAVEVINENSDKQVKIPLLVYVSREKRPTRPHNFKAGAINALLRVSGLISNSPCILFLDCDMYCNDPTSARQAMCFHLDPNFSPSLAFVQFPQKFHNISKMDIYAGRLRVFFMTLFHGADGQNCSLLAGTNFYLKRESLYGKSIRKDLVELQNCFGTSNEFIKSLDQDSNPKIIKTEKLPNSIQKATMVLCSCDYENHTRWGEEIGFMYGSLTEDFYTGFMLHCRGWRSAYLNPSRPAFLGASTTNLNDMLKQGTRWGCGIVDTASRFYPSILRMSFLQGLIYAELGLFPLIYSSSSLCLATIPQLCLLNGIPLYPKVSSPFFMVFLFNFLSVLAKNLLEVIISGDSIRTWINEQRMFMMKSVTMHLYGSLDALMKIIGAKEISFVPTNKVIDDQLDKRYQMGIFDFQASNVYLVPLVTLLILNMISCIGGIIKMVFFGSFSEIFLQVMLSFYIVVLNYPLIEGMVLRKDKGCVPLSTTLLSAMYSMVFLMFALLLFATDY